MSADYFLDTNVLVYSFDSRSPEKRAKARELIQHALASGKGAVSYQVVQEFLNVATRKFERPMAASDARDVLDRILLPLCQVFPSGELYRSGLALAERWRLPFYDALIVAGALEGECSLLYSEDFQHGQRIERLVVRNPFLQ